LVSFDVKIEGTTATSTSPFGCNNDGEIVGSFTDSKGAVNAVNDEGDIVGFYSDGNRVHGFVSYAGEI
jgi:hypothetical protein